MIWSHGLILLIVALAVSSTPTPQNLDSYNGPSIQRVKRQDTTTTPSPPKRRPSNVFSLLSVLLRETRDDARRAFGEIGRIFNSQFSASTAKPSRPPNAGQTVSSTTTAATSSGEDGDDVTTTTEPYRISRTEFNGILQNNFRGIFKLFGQELGNAIRDSGKNTLQFGRDFRDQIRPYVSLGPVKRKS